MQTCKYQIDGLDWTDPRKPVPISKTIEIPVDNSPMSETMLREYVAQGLVLQPFEYETKNGYDCKTDNLAYAFKRRGKHSVKAVFNNRHSKGINTQGDWIYWRIYPDAEYKRDYAEE